ncbi:MAG TPA: hypothetical protein VM286_05420 [Candidatus Thermoplasmatota archaeon]|nr:hypothetical protein [Candidatus Thermoplasmatota archaeon]
MSLRAPSLMLGLLALLASPAVAAQSAPACLPGLAASTGEDGAIALTWPAVANATAYQVLVRAGAEAEFTPLAPQATAAAHAYTFVPAGPGDSFEFAVVALAGGSQQLGSYCHATVTRIPFFPTWIASIVGLVGALGGVSLVLRRK